jgi:hypothetical protein
MINWKELKIQERHTDIYILRCLTVCYVFGLTAGTDWSLAGDKAAVTCNWLLTSTWSCTSSPPSALMEWCSLITGQFHLLSHILYKPSLIPHWLLLTGIAHVAPSLQAGTVAAVCRIPSESPCISTLRAAFRLRNQDRAWHILVVLQSRSTDFVV